MEVDEASSWPYAFKWGLRVRDHGSSGRNRNRIGGSCRCGLGDRDISSAHVFGDERIFACPVAHCVVAGGVGLGSDSDFSTSAGGTCRSLEELMEKGRCRISSFKAGKRQS